MQHVAATDLLEAWARSSEFDSVFRIEPELCIYATVSPDVTAVVIRPHRADRREYAKLFAIVEREQERGHLVYVATTRGGLKFARRRLAACGAGIVRVTRDGTVVVEMEPRKV